MWYPKVETEKKQQQGFATEQGAIGAYPRSAPIITEGSSPAKAGVKGPLE